MQGEGLSTQAKAIYAYFIALAGAGAIAFPRRNTVMRELRLSDMKRYYAYMQQLADRGYLSVEQGRSNGRYTINIYRLALVVLELQAAPGKYTPAKKTKPADTTPKAAKGAHDASMSP